jgi:hypothetical protein
MINLLMALVIGGIPNLPSFDTVTVTGYGPFARATATITMSMTIVSNRTLAANIDLVDPSIDGIYRLALVESMTGTSDAFHIQNDYLIIDKLNALKSEPIQLASYGDGREFSVKLPETVAMYNWPQNKSNQEMIAIYKKSRSLKKFVSIAMKF